MDGIYLAIVGIGGLGAAVAAYFGKQNLAQANVLSNPIPFSRLQYNVGRCVALRGRPHGPASGAQFLWRKITQEHYHYDRHSDGRSHGSWTTDSVREEGGPFVLEGDGAEIHVHDRPSEVYGTQTYYEDGGVAGGLSLGPITLGGEQTRVQIEMLPVTHSLTVCGRLTKEGASWVLRRDPQLGLLISANDSGSQASHEAIKGYLGLIGAPLVWLLVSLFTYRHFHPR